MPAPGGLYQGDAPQRREEKGKEMPAPGGLFLRHFQGDAPEKREEQGDASQKRREKGDAPEKREEKGDASQKRREKGEEMPAPGGLHQGDAPQRREEKEEMPADGKIFLRRFQGDVPTERRQESLQRLGSLCLHLGGLETWAEEWGPEN
ncbi:unnamed protein product [Pocillopora meandrina]|uniref:Uncharacterized protein n=1 Tax=Pocillopora meandrina TaxID=46732 RepID=A0AAU9WN25_9CNID|nr:unnamed protein product [Pocillopora meandrina]